MKTILLLGLLLAPCAVMAQSEVCNSTFTVQTVTVSSFSATLVDSASIVMPERTWIEVQNVSTDTVRCGANSALTTTTGRLLAASGGAWALGIGSGDYSVTLSTFSPYVSARTFTQRLKVYCIGNGTNISSKVVLTQCKK